MNPYQRYQEQVVTTMTQGDMLLKLYDETIKQLQLARACIQSGNIQEMDKAVNKAVKIIRYLKDTLDFRYPISNNLSKLYNFFDTQLVMASVKKDDQLIEEIEPMIVDLRNTFDQCDKMSRSNRATAATGKMA